MKKDKNKKIEKKKIEKVPVCAKAPDILKNWSYKQFESAFPFTAKVLRTRFPEELAFSFVMDMKKTLGKNNAIKLLRDIETAKNICSITDVFYLFLVEATEVIDKNKEKIKVLKKKIDNYESMSLCRYDGSCKYRSYNADKISQMLCCIKDAMKTHNILMERYDKKGAYTIVDDLIEIMLDGTDFSNEVKQSLRRADKYPMPVSSKNKRREILLRKIMPAILLSASEASMNHYGNYKMISPIMEEYISIVISGTPYALIEDIQKSIVREIIKIIPDYTDHKELLDILKS